MPGAHHQRGGLARGFLALDPHHLGPRHHDLARVVGREVEDVLDHAALGGFHHALFLRDLDHLAQLDFGGVRAVAEVRAGVEQVAHPNQQLCDGPEHHLERP